MRCAGLILFLHDFKRQYLFGYRKHGIGECNGVPSVQVLKPFECAFEFDSFQSALVFHVGPFYVGPVFFEARHFSFFQRLVHGPDHAMGVLGPFVQQQTFLPQGDDVDTEQFGFEQQFLPECVQFMPQLLFAGQGRFASGKIGGGEVKSLGDVYFRDRFAAPFLPRVHIFHFGTFGHVSGFRFETLGLVQLFLGTQGGVVGFDAAQYVVDVLGLCLTEQHDRHDACYK